MALCKCSGCDHECDDLDADLAVIKFRGGTSCCSQRCMYRRTDDVMTNAAIRVFLDYDPDEPLPEVIGVCAGEWRKEPDGAGYRAWDHPKD